MKTIAGILFALLFCILLGLSWFRTQKEVGLRASDQGVLNRNQPIRSVGNQPIGVGSNRNPRDLFSVTERIVTNGVLDLSQDGAGLKYDDRIHRHVQLRAIVNSPARDLEETLQIAQLLIRYKYGIDMLPTAYSYAWQMKDFERRFPDNSNGSPDGEKIFRIGMLQTDFRTHLERTYGRVSQQFIDELEKVTPPRDFGRINTSVRDGEPLYDEISNF